MKVLAFLPGLVCIGLGGYLAVQESNIFGWFLGIGFVLTLCALGIVDETVEKQPKLDESVDIEEE
jgi:hypothetical protein